MTASDIPSPGADGATTALCECGHSSRSHIYGVGMCRYDAACMCDSFRPAPPPVAREAMVATVLVDAPPVAREEDAEALAMRFHEAYERLASSFGYETREASAKPWAEVPENNRRLMIAVVAEVLGSIPVAREVPPAVGRLVNAVIEAAAALCHDENAEPAAALDAALDAEIAGLVADRERLDWLEAHRTAYLNPEDFEDGSDVIVGEWHGVNDRQDTDLGSGRTVREAIDAARAPRREDAR